MITRECPFCDARDARLMGKRLTYTWALCRACGSMFRDISEPEHAALHTTAEAEASLLATMMKVLGPQPAHDRWNSFGLPGSTLLEIGPGSGHTLAAARAAGREVWAVETNPMYRVHIAATWGIETVVDSFRDLPADVRFDAVLAVNMLEHVRDVRPFLREVRDLVSPAGLALVATVNAASVTARAIGPRWSMFKEIDHVSFPSPRGMRAAAAAAGFETRRLWSTELPLETPINFAVAARDYVRERRAGVTTGTGAAAATATSSAAHPSVRSPATAYRPGVGRRASRWINRVGAHREPTARLTSHFNCASSMKVLLAPVPTAAQPVASRRAAGIGLGAL